MAQNAGFKDISQNVCVTDKLIMRIVSEDGSIQVVEKEYDQEMTFNMGNKIGGKTKVNGEKHRIVNAMEEGGSLVLILKKEELLEQAREQ